MRAMHIQRYGRSPVLTRCPVPSRSAGQVLVRMRYAPINPSDLNFYTGQYGLRKDGFPVAGFEGSGVVEEADEAALVGSRVSVLAGMSNGTYCEFMVVRPRDLIFWPELTALSDEELAMFSINPLSVLGLCAIVAERKASHVLLSAAASNTGRMAAQYLAKTLINKTVIGMSRTARDDEELKRIGYDGLLRMEEFDGVRRALGESNAVFLDCVGGNFAGLAFNALPRDSVMVNYGRLSKESLGAIDPGELYFKNKAIRGFWLNSYLKGMDERQLSQAKASIVEHCSIFRQKVRKVYPLEQFVEATRESLKDQSEGKILLQLF